jgi:DNA-3-methyladenine glycosylase II
VSGRRVDVPVRGPFSLTASSRFVQEFPAGQGGGAPAQLDLAFATDGDFRPVALRVTQAVGSAATVQVDVVDAPDDLGPERLRDEVVRILSLDVDGTDFAAVRERDPVAGTVQQRFPGLRPVLFSTPYEAAAWAIIGHRISRRQAGALRRRMAAELGTTSTFPPAGTEGTHEGGPRPPGGAGTLSSFPTPERLAALGPTQGLTDLKVARLRALGQAASDGALDVPVLREMGREAGMAALQRLPGIGPFSAELVWIRGVGDPDAFPTVEPMLHRAMAEAYGLVDPNLAELERVAEAWRPFRAWMSTLLRVSVAARSSSTSSRDR